MDVVDRHPARRDEGRLRKHYNPRVVIWRESDFSRVARKVPDMTTWTRYFLLYEELPLQEYPEKGKQSDQGHITTL